MPEPEPTCRDRGRIFYDGREAWTVAVESGAPAWKRVPEMDAKTWRGFSQEPEKGDGTLPLLTFISKIADE